MHDLPPKKASASVRLTIQERFDAYHAANPEVLDFFIQFARAAKEKGFKSYGAQSIIERLRWHFNFEVRRTDEFRINNNYASRYARLAMERAPDLEGFFTLRELQTA